MSLVYFHGSNNGNTLSFAQAIYRAGFCPEPPAKSRRRAARHAPYPRQFHTRNDPLMMSMDERRSEVDQAINVLPTIEEEPVSHNLQAAIDNKDNSDGQPKVIKRFSFLVIDLALEVVHRLKRSGLGQLHGRPNGA